MLTKKPIPVMSLSDIVAPDSLSVEDYGQRRPSKIFIAGRWAGSPRRWHALYCDVRPDVHDMVVPNLVDGDLASLQLIRQIGGDHEGRILAFAEPQCGIGNFRFAVVDGLGDCVLPEPFRTLDDIARR